MHLVGYLYYWQMGFNSVFKGLTGHVHLAENIFFLYYKTLSATFMRERVLVYCMNHNTRK